MWPYMTRRGVEVKRLKSQAWLPAFWPEQSYHLFFPFLFGDERLTFFKSEVVRLWQWNKINGPLFHWSTINLSQAPSQPAKNQSHVSHLIFCFNSAFFSHSINTYGTCSFILWLQNGLKSATMTVIPGPSKVLGSIKLFPWRGQSEIKDLIQEAR